MSHLDPLTLRAQRPGLHRRLVRAAAAFYRRHERVAPAAFFFGGVTWDSATLWRIDAWFDNVFLLAYLAALGGLILVTVLVEAGQVRRPWVLRYQEWYPAAIQFFMGALFSAYVVYYSQSASLTSTSVFLLLLVGLLVANEFIHRRSVNLYLLFALYYLAAFSYFVFLVPVVLKTMTYWTFLAGGLLALGLVGGMLVFLQRRGAFETPRQLVYTAGLAAVLFGLMNVFYVRDLIPPVPLALRYGGIFHEVERVGDDYRLVYEAPPWYAFWEDSDDTFHYFEGDAVYCFAAIFAPTELEKEVYHAWSHYDERLGEWVQTDEMRYRVEGGRDDGWRGYTLKRHVRPGRWRVDVRTAEGRTLGRIRFEIEQATEPPDRFVFRTYE